MSDFIKIYDAIFNSGINILAFGLITTLSIIAIIGIYDPPATRLRQYSNQSPAILTTVGVCFSFLGIALGLIDFDPSNIEKSIPILLDSLKTKFIASLMGILASIIVKILQSFRLDKPKNNTKVVDLLSDIKQAILDNNKSNPENVITELREIIGILPKEFEKQSKLLLQVKNSLAGEGDDSVTTQLMTMRTDVKDALIEADKNNQKYLSAMQKVTNKGFNTLINEFRMFAKKMAEDNSKTLIEALENVMKDFNSKINEQFGDNFKQLNIAVGNLLIWQENYKNHVESLTDNFEITLKSVKTIESSFNYIQERSESFAVVSEKLDTLLIGVNGELRELNHHLKAFDELADNAKGAFPVIPA